MEFGGITPIGLPSDWPVLIDRAVLGRGRSSSAQACGAAKILLDAADLAALPSTAVLDLASPLA